MSDNLKENVDTTLGAGTSDKVEGQSKESVGRAKEALGEATGNDSLRAEGVKEKTEGKAQGILGEIKEGAENLLDKAKDALHKH